MPKVKRTRFLVLDSRVIEAASGAKLTLGKVEKDPHNPLFGEDKPWEKRFDNLYGNVIYDQEDRLYKCWYSPFIVDHSAKGMSLEERGKRYRPPRGREMAVCYATSKDGIKWTKPLMSIREWDGAPTNIVERGPHGAGVFKDLREKDPNRRYKMLFTERGMRVAFSRDGVRWSEPVRCRGLNVAGDTHNNILWAPTLGTYVGITREWERRPRQRLVVRTTTRDFSEWTEPKVVLKGLEPRLQTYAMPVFYHGGVYIGLIALHDQKSDRVWTELAWSPDTVEWHRVCPGTPLIPNSDEKLSYDYGCVYPCAYPVFLDDEIRLYYGGSDWLHYGWRNGFLCLATLRPDGFAGYEPSSAERPAVITTVPLLWPQPSKALRSRAAKRSESGAASKIAAVTTYLSADVREGGSVRVTLLDANGNDNENRKLAESTPVRRTVTDAEIDWQGRARAGSLEGKPVRLRFELRGAKLYSYSFSKPVTVLGAPERANAAAERLVAVGLQKQLLVDDYVIAEKHNVTRELGEVKKLGVILEPSLPTDFHPSWKKPDGSRVALDFGYYLTVLRNDRDDRWQMWYMAYRSSGVGYAESRDGIRWTKLLVAKDGKSNIIDDSQGFSCSIDPTVPWGHPEKYKSAFDSNRDRVCQACLAFSADGIRWKYYNDGKAVTHRAADTHNQILWDPVARCQRVLTRTDIGGQGGSSERRATRIMVHTAGNDLVRHPAAWKTVKDRIVVDDPADEKTRWGTPRLQFNGMTNWIYEGVYFGLMDIYTMGKSRFFDGFDYEKRHDDDFMDFYIGTSRDGVDFDKSWIHARRPFVPRGGAGSFDKDGVKPPSQIVTYKDEHWIYYAGMSERHYSRGRDLKIALAKLRLDGFVCLRAGDEPGVVVTRPFKLEGGTLQVNIDASRGEVRVEVLDAEARPVPGFSGRDAKTHTGIDELRLAPRWGAGRDLSGLKGKVIRLRFELRNAKLYAFRFGD